MQGTDLGGAMISLVRDLDPALMGLIAVCCYLLGLLAFVRGAFVLRAAADGQAGASAGRAAMHMLGGVCAWHAESLIGAVQTSLGIQVLRIT